MNPPGDVEERETNAVFDENGEVIHIQHGAAGKDSTGRLVRRTSEKFPGSVCVCVHVLHLIAVLLSWAPSLDLTPALGSVGGPSW